MSYVLYERPAGVIAYTTRLFEADRVAETVTDILSTDVEWYWIAMWRTPTSGDRPLTKLTTENRTHLVADAIERDADGYGRAIFIVGGDSSTESIRDRDSFRGTLMEFATREVEPLRIVISQIGDSPEELVFVPHEPIPSIEQLLRRWGLLETEATETHRYDRLGVAQLERMADGASRLAERRDRSRSKIQL